MDPATRYTLRVQYRENNEDLILLVSNLFDTMNSESQSPLSDSKTDTTLLKLRFHHSNFNQEEILAPNEIHRFFFHKIIKLKLNNEVKR